MSLPKDKIILGFKAPSRPLTEFAITESKLIIDNVVGAASTKICALAQHYGFTPEERNFINYDIKYRMGRDSD